MMNDCRLFTIAEVAKRLRVSRSWLDRARREGRFAGELHLGKRVLFSEQSLNEWLAEQAKQPEAA